MSGTESLVFERVEACSGLEKPCSFWHNQPVSQSRATENSARTKVVAGQPVSTPLPDDPHAEVGLPRETGGPAGPDPTRYGDWERGGRCIDF